MFTRMMMSRAQPAHFSAFRHLSYTQPFMSSTPLFHLNSRSFFQNKRYNLKATSLPFYNKMLEEKAQRQLESAHKGEQQFTSSRPQVLSLKVTQNQALSDLDTLK